MNIIRKYLIQILLSLCLVYCANAKASLVYGFDINVNFSGGLTTSQQQVFSDAEAFWEWLIIGYDYDLASYGFSSGIGLNIDASGVLIDGAGDILGQAAPTSAYGFPDGRAFAYEGLMEFDIDDLNALETAGTLFDVIVHEMAHVIGFGSLWNIGSYNNVLDRNGNYVGKYGLQAYRYETGTNADYVPVEMDGGPGTAGVHWDEHTLLGSRDIMTGYLEAPTTISLTTINSFRDLGYLVNPLFTIPEPSTSVLFVLATLVLAIRRKLVIKALS